MPLRTFTIKKKHTKRPRVLAHDILLLRGTSPPLPPSTQPAEHHGQRKELPDIEAEAH